MHTDLPLNKAKEDKLGRFQFATEIADGLVKAFEDSNESLVLGINGTWGSGKSTLINFIILEVERLSQEMNKNIIILRFNPWMFSGQKELQNIFLKELYLKFEKQKDKLKRASKKLADFLGHLNWLKYIHSGTGEALGDVKSFLEGLGKEQDLSQLKNDIDKLLIESKVKLYITIDDIDRLTPLEITDIFQMVKLNGNFANTIFILAYDQEVVVNALQNQFGENGRKYIEKIVQVDYTLPNISKNDITRIFIDSLDHLISDPKVIDGVKNSIESIKTEPFIQFFRSIRDVYRFNNSIKLRINSIYSDLNMRDFFLLEALRVFKPAIYWFILNSKDKLTQKATKSNILSPVKNGDTESISDYINKQEFDNTGKEIIKCLFEFEGFRFFYRTTPEDLIREKRIANPQLF